MDDLTAKQRAHLRGLAHALKPMVHVGKEGVTSDAVKALEQVFANRELVKVRVLETAPAQARETAAELAAAIPNLHVVQTVGRTVVLYRVHPEQPQIRLPHPRKRAPGA